MLVSLRLMELRPVRFALGEGPSFCNSMFFPLSPQLSWHLTLQDPFSSNTRSLTGQDRVSQPRFLSLSSPSQRPGCSIFPQPYNAHSLAFSHSLRPQGLCTACIFRRISPPLVTPPLYFGPQLVLSRQDSFLHCHA